MHAGACLPTASTRTMLTKPPVNIGSALRMQANRTHADEKFVHLHFNRPSGQLFSSTPSRSLVTQLSTAAYLLAPFEANRREAQEEPPPSTLTDHPAPTTMQPSKLPIDCSFRLTLASAPFQPLLPHCVSRFRDKSSILISLRTLILSCRSLCNSRPFFSITCGLFVQNTGGWGIPRTLAAPQHINLLAPLFSWSYELLFAQPLYFDNHLRCPPGVGVRLSSQPAKTVLLFSTWRHTSALPFKQLSADAVLLSAHVRPVLPPFHERTFVCPQTAHVAVDAFPSKLLSICLEATWRAASSPSGPKPSSSAAMARGSSRLTSSPPNRNWSSAASRLTRRSRPASWARSAPRATPTSTASPSWTAPSI